MATAAMRLSHFLTDPQLLQLTQAALGHAVHATHSNAPGVCSPSEEAQIGDKNGSLQQDSSKSWVVPLALSLADALLTERDSMTRPPGLIGPGQKQAPAYSGKQGSAEALSNPLGGRSNSNHLAVGELGSHSQAMNWSAEQGDLQQTGWDVIVPTLVDLALAGLHQTDALVLKLLQTRRTSGIAHALDRYAFGSPEQYIGLHIYSLQCVVPCSLREIHYQSQSHH